MFVFLIQDFEITKLDWFDHVSTNEWYRGIQTQGLFNHHFEIFELLQNLERNFGRVGIFTQNRYDFIVNFVL